MRVGRECSGLVDCGPPAFGGKLESNAVSPAFLPAANKIKKLPVEKGGVFGTRRVPEKHMSRSRFSPLRNVIDQIIHDIGSDILPVSVWTRPPIRTWRLPAFGGNVFRRRNILKPVRATVPRQPPKGLPKFLMLDCYRNMAWPIWTAVDWAKVGSYAWIVAQNIVCLLNGTGSYRSCRKCQHANHCDSLRPPSPVPL